MRTTDKTYAVGEVPWLYPHRNPPPLGVDLNILQEGGVSIRGQWKDNAGFIAWQYMFKRDKQAEEEAEFIRRGVLKRPVSVPTDTKNMLVNIPAERVKDKQMRRILQFLLFKKEANDREIAAALDLTTRRVKDYTNMLRFEQKKLFVSRSERTGGKRTLYYSLVSRREEFEKQEEANAV